MNRLLKLTAFIEAATGFGLIVIPSVVVRLLLGSPLDTPAAVTLGRVAGVALLALGLACWLARADTQSPATRGLVVAMLMYNIAATAVLAFAGIGLGLRGVALWPAVVLHAAMALWCVACLRPGPQNEEMDSNQMGNYDGRKLSEQTAERVMSGSPSKHTLPMKKNLTRSLVAGFVLIPAALLAQSLAPTPPSSGQAELSKVEEWVLSQGAVESIAPELAAILGLGSDRLPVKLKSYRTSDGISLAFAVSTNPSQTGIVLSALKTMANNGQIYSVGNAWLTDRSGTLRKTIAVDASGARVVPNNSRAAKFKDTKTFFIKKLQATSPTTLSPLPEHLQQPREGKKKPGDKSSMN